MAATRDQLAAIIGLGSPYRLLPTAGSFDVEDQAHFALLARLIRVAGAVAPTVFTGVATPFYVTRIRRI